MCWNVYPQVFNTNNPTSCSESVHDSRYKLTVIYSDWNEAVGLYGRRHIRQASKKCHQALLAAKLKGETAGLRTVTLESRHFWCSSPGLKKLEFPFGARSWLGSLYLLRSFIIKMCMGERRKCPWAEQVGEGNKANREGALRNESFLLMQFSSGLTYHKLENMVAGNIKGRFLKENKICMHHSSWVEVVLAATALQVDMVWGLLGFFFHFLWSVTSTPCLSPGDSGKALKAGFLGLIGDVQKSCFILCAELIAYTRKGTSGQAH